MAEVKEKILKIGRRLLSRRKTIDQIAQFDGPTSAGGATMNVYWYDDGTLETVEWDWHGREIARYEGEPREVPPGVRMPDAPPRPPGAAPLPTPIGGGR